MVRAKHWNFRPLASEAFDLDVPGPAPYFTRSIEMSARPQEPGGHAIEGARSLIGPSRPQSALD